MKKGKQNKFNAREPSAYKRELKGLEVRETKKDPFIVLGFKDFDRNQGQSFEEWEDEKLLALAMNKLREVCQKTVVQAITEGVIKQYTKVSFPPESSFEHPKHILPDVTWCSMHIQGKECVIGYFEDNIFQVVFLDKNHEFWQTHKKNT
jgi:hypothetical protein